MYLRPFLIKWIREFINELTQETVQWITARIGEWGEVIITLTNTVLSEKSNTDRHLYRGQKGVEIESWFAPKRADSPGPDTFTMDAVEFYREFSIIKKKLGNSTQMFISHNRHYQITMSNDYAGSEYWKRQTPSAMLIMPVDPVSSNFVIVSSWIATNISNLLCIQVEYSVSNNMNWVLDTSESPSQLSYSVNLYLDSSPHPRICSERAPYPLVHWTILHGTNYQTTNMMLSWSYVCCWFKHGEKVTRTHFYFGWYGYLHITLCWKIRSSVHAAPSLHAIWGEGCSPLHLGSQKPPPKLISEIK